MDYGLFRRFDKIDSATAVLPRAIQEGSLFLVECRLAKEGTTRSVPVPMQLERSAFGEILKITIAMFSRYADVSCFDGLQKLLAAAEPPIRMSYEADQWSLVFFDDEPAQRQTVQGLLIFTLHNELATLVARLHS